MIIFKTFYQYVFFATISCKLFYISFFLQLALSILETKSKIEIENARKTILDKDVELQETEESLAGLKEVSLGTF